MSEPKNSYDPGAAVFLRVVRDAAYTDSSHDDDFFAIDKTRSDPNHRGMSDLTRQEIDAKLAQNKAEVDARLANFDTSVKTGFADLRAEFAGLRTEMAKMRGEAEKQSHDSTKWIIGAVFGMLSLSVAILAAIINFNKGDKQVASQPAPIVITVPSAPAASASPAGNK